MLIATESGFQMEGDIDYHTELGTVKVITYKRA